MTRNVFDRYRAHIQPGQRKFIKQYAPEYFDIAHMSGYKAYAEPYTQTINSIQIDMLPEDFDRLKADLEAIQHVNRYDEFRETSVVLEQKYREQRIRKNNPAAQKAYERYQTLLTMVDSYYE